MSRYIDADLLLAQCRRNPLFEKTKEDKRMIYIERSIIDATPTADVVEVVRCKDCKKWEHYENTSGAGYCHNKKYCFTYGTMLDREFTPITMPDDYCSYGERKEL